MRLSYLPDTVADPLGPQLQRGLQAHRPAPAHNIVNKFFIADEFS